MISIADPPAFKVHPRNISVSMNSAIIVNCTYQNFTAVKFQWIKDGTIFTPPVVLNKNAYKEDSVVSPQNQQGHTVKSFTIQGVEPDVQGYYHCMVKDALNHTVNSTKSLVRFKGSKFIIALFLYEFHIHETHRLYPCVPYKKFY